MMFMFCTALPDAPLVRLSMTLTITALFVRGFFFIPMRQLFVPRTSFVEGKPSPRTRTKREPR